MFELLSQPHILFSLALTAKACGVALALFLLVAPAIGFLLARTQYPGVRLMGFIITLPLIFPPVAMGYLLLVLLGRYGFLGQYFSEMGLQLVFTPAAVYLASFVAGLPLVVRPLQAAFASERLRELEAAARIHGATPLSVFRTITLPLARPSLAVGLLMGCARSAGEVGITMMLGGNISGKTNTLSLEIFNAVSRADFDEANALSLILVLVAAIIFLLMEALLKKSPKF